MSNKSLDKLDRSDRELRLAFPPAPASPPVQVTIRKISGFELFNTRPYHNYETWSDGYEAEAEGITARSEDLDDAVSLLVARVQRARKAAKEGSRERSDPMAP